MKILKLNESLYSGKIDNLYKKSILYESVKLKEESLKIINEYLEYNLQFRKKYFINYKNTFNNVFGGGSIVNPTDIEDNEIIEFELENNRFLLNNKRGTKHWLTQKETLELLSFVNNPDLISLVRSQKKYNI